MKKILSLVLSFLILVSMIGCGSNAKSKGVTVSDSRGVQVSLEAPPQKMISLIPSDTEILYALGVGDKLIAVSDYCNYPEDTAKKQKLPTGEQLNIETLIAMKPDVVFLGQMSAMEDQVKQLESAGIKVVVTEANSLDETYQVIEMIGVVTGKSKEASKLVSDMKTSFEAIVKGVAGLPSLKVYVEVSPLQYGLWSCGEGTFVQELLVLVGAENIFRDVSGWSAVSEEQVIERNPDIILTTASPLTGIEDPVGDIVGRQNWSGINAVKNQDVFMLDADMLSRPGPRLVLAAEELLKAMGR